MKQAFTSDSLSNAFNMSAKRIIGELRTVQRVTYLKLASDAIYTENIICETFGVHRVSTSLLRYLQERSKGNCLHICDAVRQYQEDGIVAIDDGQLSTTSKGKLLLKNVHDLSGLSKGRNQVLPIPISVESFFDEVIDTLELEQQIILKVASQIGKHNMVYNQTENAGVRVGAEHGTFAAAEVKDALGRGKWNGVVLSQFQKLAESGIIIPMKDGDTNQPNLKNRYRFKSEWMRESVDNRLLYRQKDKLWNIMDRIYKEIERELQREALKHMTPEMEQMEGYLQVKKKSNKNSYVKRFCILRHGEIIEFEKSDQRVVKTTVSLHSPVAELIVPSEGQNRFIIKTDHWSKPKSKNETSLREFEFMVETRPEAKQWTTRIGLQIARLREGR